MPLTCTVWHGRLGTLAIAHHHSSEVRTTLLLIFMFQFQYRLIIDSRRICLKLSFFSIFFGFETCLSSWRRGVRCPRWPGEPTALSGVFPLLPGSHLIGIPIGDPAGFGCPFSLSCCPSSHTYNAGLATAISSLSHRAPSQVFTQDRWAIRVISCSDEYGLIGSGRLVNAAVVKRFEYPSNCWL